MHPNVCENVTTATADTGHLPTPYATKSKVECYQNLFSKISSYRIEMLKWADRQTELEGRGFEYRLRKTG